MIIEPAYELFDCERIATKAITPAVERRKVLDELGFSESTEKLIGHDGMEYGDYFEIAK